VIGRLTDQAYEGEITLGVPHDIVYPAIPQVLKQLHAAFPRVQVNLIASNTVNLKAQYARGECDLFLTTEIDKDPGAETLCTKPLHWIGAPDGSAWRQHPVRLAFGRTCTFRARAVEALDHAGIPWQVIVETDSDKTLEATVSADLAIQTLLDGTVPPHLEKIDHGGALPDLPEQLINLYGAHAGQGVVKDTLADLLRRTFRPSEAARLKAV
jgi:DNA-binding transcriptional LysR family regulator